MDNSGGVVVGLDDDPSNLAALDWAADEAVSRGCDLHIVRAYVWAPGLLTWNAHTDQLRAIDLEQFAVDQLHEAARRLQEHRPTLRVRTDAADGIAWDVLLDRTERAAVTVLGSRRLGTLGAAVLGSVSTVVAARASGPVVVVEGPAGDLAENPSVVVGVDGSSCTDDVLAFGFDHASRRGRPLHAVFCWRPDLLATMQWRPSPPAPDQADRWLAESVAGWQEKFPDVVVHRSVVRDHPVTGLVAAAATQDLLVVGARTAHARTAALLGSVSQGVLHHATCPVAVIHSR